MPDVLFSLRENNATLPIKFHRLRILSKKNDDEINSDLSNLTVDHVLQD